MPPGTTQTTIHGWYWGQGPITMPTQPGSPTQPGYAAPPGSPVQPGFPAPPGSPAQPGSPARPGYAAPPGSPA
ncbi:hypothetical protein CNMCM8812_005815 [Aspergillus fumigatus]